MKLKLIAVAGLLATQAYAQSSITAYGVVDLGYVKGTGDMANWSGLASGRNMSSRLGFKGEEDLGSGLKASFTLEADIGANTGTGVTTPFAGWSSTDNKSAAANGGLQFNRVAIVGLSGAWGAVTAGRNYTPTFLLDFAYDPFGENGAGASLITLTSAYFNTAGSVNHLRASNLVTYSTPANNTGFNAMLSIAPSVNNSSLPNDGAFTSGKVGYVNGALMADVAWAKTKLVASGDIKTTSVAAAYDLGMIRPVIEYSRDELGAAGANASKKGFLVGATAPLGLGQARMSYSKVEKTADNSTAGNVTQLAVGYVYNLSKRTALYATYSHVNNTNYRNTPTAGYSVGSAVTSINGSNNGYDFGIRTTF